MALAHPDYVGQQKEGEDILLMARIVNESDVAIQQADVDTWDLDMYDLSDQENLTTATSIVSGGAGNATTADGSDVFRDSLATGEGWAEDDVGFDMRYIALASAHSGEGGHRLRFELSVNRTGGRGPLKVAWEVDILSTLQD